MNYPETGDFDRTNNGNANRIDADADPRVLLLDISPDNRTARLHFAGELNIRSALVSELAEDAETIEGMEPIDAFRVGRASHGQ